MNAAAVAVEGHTAWRTLAGHYAAGLRLDRATSPRQLPTDHDYAVPTREYQSDQPSRPPLSTAPAAALNESRASTQTS